MTRIIPQTVSMCSLTLRIFFQQFYGCLPLCRCIIDTNCMNIMFCSCQHECKEMMKINTCPAITLESALKALSVLLCSSTVILDLGRDKPVSKNMVWNQSGSRNEAIKKVKPLNILDPHKWEAAWCCDVHNMALKASLMCRSPFNGWNNCIVVSPTSLSPWLYCTREVNRANRWTLKWWGLRHRHELI